ncbi:MAG TPA: NfeD family protein [Solirubrobacteraceae bacterium]|jgi:membrane-bound serine protease (ClpP class)|nr:NfeD family protein [Solirubrobacteraceae bacterium]
MTALGIALLTLGAIVIIVETHVPSLGMLGGPGVVALAAGSVLAVSGLGGGLLLGVITALVLTISATVALGLVLRRGVAVRGRRIKTGAEGLIGRTGVVRTWSDTAGRVQVDGALWRAHHSWLDESDEELHEGDHVVVERLTGLTLAVRKAEEWEQVR